MTSLTTASGFDELLTRAQEGDERAWRLIFEEYAHPVAGYLRVQGATDVDDALGDVFCGVFRSIGSFRGSASQFRSWVFVIAHHRVVDERRRRARLSIDPWAEPPEPELRPEGANGSESIALDGIGASRVAELCSRLAPDQRDVLLLRIVGDLSIDQIASALDKSRGAVKALQRRGLSVLAREIQREGVPL